MERLKQILKKGVCLPPLAAILITIPVFAFLIFVMAAYTFYAVIMAVVNLIKFRKRGSPVLSAAKVISLAAALVSMLALETAMLSQFGQKEDPMFRQVMTAFTGAGVCIIILVVAVFMIVWSTRQLKQYKSRGIDLERK